MLIPRGVLSERSYRTLVERGKVWVALVPSVQGCLRDVPAPRETVLDCEGPAAWISRGALEPREEMLGASLVAKSLHSNLCG